MNDELKNRLIKSIVINPIAIGSLFIIFLASCSVQKQIAKSASKDVLDAGPLQTALVGISIYEPATNKYWYDHQGDKYFTPASNTKIPTCYAAMKYLGDSLVGLRYGYAEEVAYKNRLLIVQPTGDPTFLHPDYKSQIVFNFLKEKVVAQNFECGFMDTIWKEDRWGTGWSWNDYEELYMAERSSFPILGNIITISLNDVKDRNVDTIFQTDRLKMFKTDNEYFDSLVNQNRLQSFSKRQFNNPLQYWKITRGISGNYFDVERSPVPFSSQAMPFVTYGSQTTINILTQSLKKYFGYVSPTGKTNKFYYECPGCDIGTLHINKWNIIHSQPTDSILKPMMHRSDNFFAEQTLLMVSNERLGFMNDEKIIDTILKTDLKDLPQKPRWVDGSGLSRYNLFTPQDLVFILNKMKNEFGMARVKGIFPTGGQGTLANYYITDSSYLYAKTGTLFGVVALSGYLYTKKGKELIFSILVNNHRASGTEVRRAVEKFLQGIRNKY